jgi:REP element-mobilizing transposase RayT
VPRPPRIQAAGAVYHVTSNGAVDQHVFRVGSDRDFFLEKLGEVVERCEWACHAYCLLGTHFHLLVRTPKPNIAKGMQLLKGQYGQRFNAIYGQRGAVFARRYDSELVQRDEHLLEVFRYIALNPVRAGLCGDPASWPWSSYAAVTGHAAAPSLLALDWVLGLFGGNAASARRRFAEFVRDGLVGDFLRGTGGV